LYYRLNHHCSLVEGTARGAIYDFQSGKVHSINKSAAELIKECGGRKLTQDFFKNKEAVEFLESLCQLGLGSFYINNPGNLEYMPRNVEEEKLDFLWLELTSRCNNKCLHCYTASGPISTQRKSVSHERWLSLISEAAKAEASSIQLIGGEPLLYPLWRELVLRAENEGFDCIEIFTNGTLIDEETAHFFQEHKVQVATTIYADNAEIHDAVTQHPGSFDKTMRAIEKLLELHVPLRIASIIMKTNEQEVENIINLLDKLGVEVNPPDVIRPTGRGENSSLIPDSYTKEPIRPPFFTDEETFSRLHNYHNCLGGILAITAEGDVIPCIFARNQVCGSILTASLQEVISGEQLQECWHTTKDQVNKCKDCEYRYACHDCRPLAQGGDLEKRWLARPRNCSYDPYTGKWED